MISLLDKYYYSGPVINDNTIHYITKPNNDYNNISLTGLIIDNFYQLENEILILKEDTDVSAIFFNDITYNTIDDLLTDLELKLNAASPNTLIYAVDINNINDNKIRIDCASSKTITLEFSDIMKNMYGFINRSNVFISTLRSEKQYNLTPINNILIKSNLSLTSSIDNEEYYDILGVYNISNLGKYNQFELLSSARKYNKVTNFKLIFTTETGLFINRSAKYFIEITIFKLETFNYLDSYIEYQFSLIKKKAEIEREKHLRDLLAEEEIIKNKAEETTQNQN